MSHALPIWTSGQLPMVFKPTTSVDVASFANELHRNRSIMFKTACFCKLHSTKLPPCTSCFNEEERYHARQGSAPGNILFVDNHCQSLFLCIITAKMALRLASLPLLEFLKETIAGSTVLSSALRQRLAAPKSTLLRQVTYPNNPGSNSMFRLRHG